MKGLRIMKGPIVLAVCFGMLIPASSVQAAEAKTHAGKPSIEVSDIVLDAQGALEGVVVDVHGAPQSKTKVAILRQKREIGRVQADRLGRFRLSGLRGGVYTLQAGNQVRFVRLWTAKAAPPKAKQMALMVTGDGVVRGQMPLEQFFASDAVVIAGLVAALVAIPIVVSNQGDSGPASP